MLQVDTHLLPTMVAPQCAIRSYSIVYIMNRFDLLFWGQIFAMHSNSPESLLAVNHAITQSGVLDYCYSRPVQL